MKLSIDIELTSAQYMKLIDIVGEENQIPIPTQEDVIDFIRGLVIRETEI